MTSKVVIYGINKRLLIIVSDFTFVIFRIFFVRVFVILNYFFLIRSVGTAPPLYFLPRAPPLSAMNEAFCMLRFR